MLDGSETASLSGERDFGGLRGRVVWGGFLGRRFSGCEGEVVMGLVRWEGEMGIRGRVAGLGVEAGEGVLRAGDELVDSVGCAQFWAGLLGGKSCGVDGRGDGEQVVVGETGAAVSFGLRGNGGLVWGREKRISSIFVRVSSVSWTVEDAFGMLRRRVSRARADRVGLGCSSLASSMHRMLRKSAESSFVLWRSIQ